MDEVRMHPVVVSTDGRAPLAVGLAVVKELTAGLAMDVQEYDVDSDMVSVRLRTTRKTRTLARKLLRELRGERAADRRPFSADG